MSSIKQPSMLFPNIQGGAKNIGESPLKPQTQIKASMTKATNPVDSITSALLPILLLLTPENSTFLAVHRPGVSIASQNCYHQSHLIAIVWPPLVVMFPHFN